MNQVQPVSVAQPEEARGFPRASFALTLLLGINLLNYIDRYVLAGVMPKLQLDAAIFSPTDPWLKTKLGALTTMFMVSYMLMSPVFGWLGDKRSRWMIIGLAVILWSLASGGSGLAVSFWMLLATRCLVGVGEAAYGPVAPAILCDIYEERRRGKILALFYAAIPVGSALGFVIGGTIADTPLGWRWAFLVVVLPGLLLGLLCFRMTDPPRSHRLGERIGPREYPRVLKRLFQIRSYRLNTLGMTASTFVLGGVAVWVPLFIFEREASFVITQESIVELRQLETSAGTPVVPAEVLDKLEAAVDSDRVMDTPAMKAYLAELLTPAELELYAKWIYDPTLTEDSLSTGAIGLYFGAILVVSGLLATLLGGYLGDRFRDRFPGAYFWVAGIGQLIGLPFFIAMLFLPFPYAWGAILVAVFCLFLNTGPTNTVLANVTHSSIRATGFAINILIIHAFGDAISPLIIGAIADVTNLRTAFFIICAPLALSGLLWIWGAQYLRADTDRAAEFRLE